MIYRSYEKPSGPTATSALSGKVDVCADCRDEVLLIARSQGRRREIAVSSSKCAHDLAIHFCIRFSLQVRAICRATSLGITKLDMMMMMMMMMMTIMMNNNDNNNNNSNNNNNNVIKV